jgi:Na+/melibiose symporter-like transporter
VSVISNLLLLMKAVNEQHNLKMQRLPHSSLLHPDPELHSHPNQQNEYTSARTTAEPQQQQQHVQPHRQFPQQQQQFRHDNGHLDTAFYAIHLLMSAVHKRVLVTSREQLGFEAAMAIFAAALLMRLFFKPLYTRIRPQLVFTVHILLTIIRASVVYTMSSKQVRRQRQHYTSSHSPVTVVAPAASHIVDCPCHCLC